MSYETSLKQTLQDRDSELFGRLKKIEKIARSLLSYTHGKFPYYIPHDFSHSLNVEENLNWIIVDDVREKMNAYEMFFLIVAAWMHDWGMVGKPEEKPGEIREFHHLRTEKYFEEMSDKLFLSEHEGRIIGRICRGHTKEDLYIKDFDDTIFGSNIRIRRRFLAAILRMADECDITHNRTPEVIYYSLDPTEKAKEEFDKHLDIGGIGQLDEKHKIYISAIARDPKGADTLRKVRDKIQRELDAVKSILASCGVVLDYIELRMENRGFIDKPIDFKVDQKKIVDLLIGEHLYRNRDVAIRELVQNSIDACKLRKQIEPNLSFMISIKKPGKNILIVEDNGIGMDYSTAKKFLSIVGSSYYTSDEFKRLIKGKKFDPIANFGIGIMSCFLMSDGIIIETKKKGFDPCKFTISSTEQAWKYEKGSLKNPGTRIILILNKEGKIINILKTLKKYFIDLEIPIQYQSDDDEIRKFESRWSFDQIVERFHQEVIREVPRVRNVILQFETENYRAILGSVDNWYTPQLVLFSHGVHIGNFDLIGLEFQYVLCVDVRKDLFDLQISREDVIRNKRWSDFVQNVLNRLFDFLNDRFLPNEQERYLETISALFGTDGTRFTISAEQLDSSENLPVLMSILDNIFVPIKSQNGLEFRKLNDVLVNDEVTFYQIYSKEPLKAIRLVSEFLPKNRLTIFDPYRLPGIRKRPQEDAEPLICFFLRNKGMKIHQVDLLNILNENCSPLDLDLGDLGKCIPHNIKLARFPKDWNPLVIIHRKPIVTQVEVTLGSSYWGNIFLWKDLMDEDRAFESVSNLGFRQRYLKHLKMTTEAIVFVDVEDDFIGRLFDIGKKKKLDERLHQLIYRYFKYLSFLPLIIQNLSSSLIILEILDNLETEIANLLSFDSPQPLLCRMGTVRISYLDYLRNANTEDLYEIKKSQPDSSLSHAGEDKS